MRYATLKLGVFTATAGTTPLPTAKHAAYFKLTDGYRDELVVELTDPAKIKKARDIVAGHLPKIIVGRISKTSAGYAPKWSFHYEPGTVDFVEKGLEVCDANIRYLNDHLDEAGTVFLPGLIWCPISGRLNAEVPAK